eukprot:TRINITY_DN24682_c0_g2_i1.p1 TRINITY_DN24682_c0_g2~~TRINITY_DN24682_c0_g2_i1.p1  ORF type:complete len:377 (-),score=20.27 TRINITY_DN24682_c0_g2_i1:150-1280(-)
MSSGCWATAPFFSLVSAVIAQCVFCKRLGDDSDLKSGLQTAPGTSLQAQGALTLSAASYAVRLLPVNTIDGPLAEEGCMFSFVQHGGKAHYAGSYRKGSCRAPGDHVVAFEAKGLEQASKPEDVRWLWNKTGSHGEDPRCFVWRQLPHCLYWRELDGPFFILPVSGNNGQPIEIDEEQTRKIGGKNWIPIPQKNGRLLIVVSITPLRVFELIETSRTSAKLERWHWAEGPVGFEWRGGTPAVAARVNGNIGYVGIGHHSLSNTNHKVFSYLFSEDVKEVELSSEKKFLLPTDADPTGIWDPLSIWHEGEDIKAVVSYWDDSSGGGQQTHIYSLAVSGTGDDSKTGSMLSSSKKRHVPQKSHHLNKRDDVKKGATAL